MHVTTTSTQHIMITANRALENANPSTKESPSASLDSNPSSNEAKNVTDVLSLTKSRNSDQIQVSEVIIAINCCLNALAMLTISAGKECSSIT